MNRKKIRTKIMIVLYQHLLINKDIQILINEEYQMDYSMIDDFSKSIIEDVLNNQQLYTDYIDHNLTGWSFNRLGFIEQAILLMSCSEQRLALNDNAIIINEAVELAKTYCDDEAFKLINGVLDK